VLDLGSWSLIRSGSHVRFLLVPILVDKPIQSHTLALNGAHQVGGQISRFLNRMSRFKKIYKFKKIK